MSQRAKLPALRTRGNVRDVETRLRRVEQIAVTGSTGSSSGGGGSASWGGITGTLSSQTDLQTALNAKAASSSLTSHTGATSGAHGISAFGATLVDDADAAAARTTLGAAAAAHGHAGIPVTGQVVVTVAGAAWEHEQTVSAAGLTGSMQVVASVAPHADTDENHETMLDVVALGAQAGTDTLTVRLGFGEPTSGPIRVNYMAA